MKFDQVHLVGLGGTGSHLALPLVQLLTYHTNGTRSVVFWDGDDYEQKNQERQAFDSKGLNSNKALVKAQELKDLNPDITVYDFWCTRESFQTHFDNHPAKLVLVVLAVDNDATRNQLINYFDRLDPSQSFVFVLPGNGFTSFNTFWYGRLLGEVCPVHPFEVADNWQFPKDGMPGGCGAVVKSSPQIITANFGAAWSSLLRIYCLLEDKPMPFNLDHQLDSFAMFAEGRPKYFSEKTLKAVEAFQASNTIAVSSSAPAEKSVSAAVEKASS